MICENCGSAELTQDGDKMVCDFCHTRYEIDTRTALDKEPTNAFNFILKAQQQANDYMKTDEYKEEQKKDIKL